MTWHPLPTTASNPSPSDVEDIERRLEQWSKSNAIDGWAFLRTDGWIEVQDAETGALLATLPDMDTFDDFAHNADLADAA